MRQAKAVLVERMASVDSTSSPGRTMGESGRELYALFCGVCHGHDGRGIQAVGSPLVGSDWVLANGPNRLIRIVLGGLHGPIRVRVREFNGKAPPLRDVMSDEQIAAVLTYTRNNNGWGHALAPVSAREVRAIRAATESRVTPWTATELLTVPLNDYE